MNRRRIAIGVSSVSGLAVVAAGAMSMFGSGSSANAVDLHATPVAAVSGAPAPPAEAGTAQVDTVVTSRRSGGRRARRDPGDPAQTLTMHGTGLSTSASRSARSTCRFRTGALQRGADAGHGSTCGGRPTAGDRDGRRGPGLGLDPHGHLAGLRRQHDLAVASTEPSLALAMLGGAQPGVREVGQDVVRGVPVRALPGHARPGAAAAGADRPRLWRRARPAGSRRRREARRSLNAGRAFTTTKVPFDAYLDGQGRLRRFVATFSFLANPAAKQVDQVAWRPSSVGRR